MSQSVRPRARGGAATHGHARIPHTRRTATQFTRHPTAHRRRRPCAPDSCQRVSRICAVPSRHVEQSIHTTAYYGIYRYSGPGDSCVRGPSPHRSVFHTSQKLVQKCSALRTSLRPSLRVVTWLPPHVPRLRTAVCRSTAAPLAPPPAPGRSPLRLQAGVAAVPPLGRIPP